MQNGAPDVPTRGTLRGGDTPPKLDGEVFQPLRDEAVFGQVTVDEFGAVCWPNGPDLAPDAMHCELTGEPTPQSRPHREKTDGAKRRAGG